MASPDKKSFLLRIDPSLWAGVERLAASELRRVEDAGLEVLLLDQTRPSVGLPVVRMVVPGLRSMRPRFAPGRLFDVPVLVGRRPTPSTPDGFNPVPLFV